MSWQLRLSERLAPAQTARGDRRSGRGDRKRGPREVAGRSGSRPLGFVVVKVTVTHDIGADAAPPDPSDPSDDVAEVVSKLIQFDTTNTGELETTQGEAACARWIAEQLAEVGYETEYVESGAPGRGNVFARLAGADRSRGALMIHGDLDGVPAEPGDWGGAPVC